jgi:hypothetical protein
MLIPKYLIADNSDLPEVVFVVHTDFPRFILNVTNDEIQWFENFSVEDEELLPKEAENFVKEALEFYDREFERSNS